MKHILGMLYIQELGLAVKIHRDNEGLYIYLPSHGEEKLRITKKE